MPTHSKFIESNVRKARLINLIGAAGNTNVQGEDQKKLDVLSNEIMINALRASGKAAVLVSEENDEAIFVGEREAGATFESNRGKYCVVFDPLDGSSNIDAGVNIGTIFGIYLVRDGSKGELADVLRPGKEMVASGYCMYGSSANLVLTTGNGVNGYTLDNAIGEFILTHPNITLPPRGKIYSINEGNTLYYHEPVLKWLDSLKHPKDGKSPYSARYIGECSRKVRHSCGMYADENAASHCPLQDPWLQTCTARCCTEASSRELQGHCPTGSRFQKEAELRLTNSPQP